MSSAPAPEAWRNRIIGYDEVTADQLEANPHNPKFHDQQQQSAMTAILNDVGFVVPIIVNRPTMRIVDGHMRADLVAERGGTIPVAYVDLTPDEEAEILALLDPIGRMATYDSDALAAVLAGLTTSVDLTDVLAGLGAGKGPVPVMHTDPDEVPEPPPPISVLGDLWLLGDHRLLCADANDAASHLLVLDGGRPNVIFTDPPYGMNLDVKYQDMHSARRASSEQNYRPVVGDEQDYNAARLITMYDDVAEQFWFGADYYRSTIGRGGSWVVWDKRANDQNMKLDDLIGGAFELCWSRTKHKRDIARILWAGHHGLQREDTKRRIHPTQKPVGLVTWFLERWSKPGAVVLDFYAGSGSTLIGCHQIDRATRLIELDPRYVDVICKRWQRATDITPVNQASGLEVDFTG